MPLLASNFAASEVKRPPPVGLTGDARVQVQATVAAVLELGLGSRETVNAILRLSGARTAGELLGAFQRAGLLTDIQALDVIARARELAALPQPGQVLAGKWRVERLLGRGAFGAVFEATPASGGPTVAVKVLSARSAPALVRFRHEAEALAALDVPGLVRILEVGADGGRPFLVLELIDGPTLLEWAAAQRPAPAESVRIVAALAETMALVHARGVVHRDLKPANVLMGPGDEPRIVDLGLARADGDTRVTATGQLVGSLGYAAPEAFLGKDLLSSADVFSLGVVLWELLARRCLRSRGRWDRIALSALEEVPSLVASRGIGRDLDETLRRACAPDPARRLTMSELARRLRSLSPHRRDPG